MRDVFRGVRSREGGKNSACRRKSLIDVFVGGDTTNRSRGSKYYLEISIKSMRDSFGGNRSRFGSKYSAHRRKIIMDAFGGGNTKNRSRTGSKYSLENINKSMWDAFGGERSRSRSNDYTSRRKNMMETFEGGEANNEGFSFFLSQSSHSFK